MSGFVPGFEDDLFISYAHADDPVWIQALERSLGEELSRHLGAKVSIWKDEKRLRVGQNWKTEIETGVQRSAIFIAMLSPLYENSEWCTSERGIFRQLFAAQEEFENSNRFIKIVKKPWDNDGHLHFLSAIENLDFFRREEGTVEDVEFQPGTDDFRITVSKLVNAVARTLQRLRRKRERVFVASPAKDCLDIWKQLREELRNQGYDVQPDGLRDDGFADDLIRPEMEGALLSVHLLGSNYDSFVERQIRLAADLEQRLMFGLTPGAEATADASQTRLIEILRDGKRPDRPSAKLPPPWTLLRDLTPRHLIEEVEALLKPKPTVAVQPSTNGGVSSLYIVHDATTVEDTRIAVDLREQIIQREGLSVFLSRADLPSAADLRQRHEKLMQTCEGVLLYRNTAPKEWLMQAAPEVIFAEKLLQRGPFKSRAFLVPDPNQWLGWPNLQTISYSAQFHLEDLEPFLAPLRVQGRAAGGV